jgi:hypothetical protein
MMAYRFQGSKSEWQMLFIITAAILVVGAVVFCLFADGKVQPWAKTKGNEVEMTGNSEVV